MRKAISARGRDELGLADRVLQIPFLPHWRVPEFLRGCLAVCCLEQDFPIAFHTPIIPREVLLCGTCLVASTEVIRKLPYHERLPHGYGCVAMNDVNDIQALRDSSPPSRETPRRAQRRRARTQVRASAFRRSIAFPRALEQILGAAAARRSAGAARRQARR